MKEAIGFLVFVVFFTLVCFPSAEDRLTGDNWSRLMDKWDADNEAREAASEDQE